MFYCFEYQSQDDARRIMRENHVQYLIVLNNELRVLGTLWMEDLRVKLCEAVRRPEKTV